MKSSLKYLEGWPGDKPTSNTTTITPAIPSRFTTTRHMTTTSSLCQTLEECDTGKPHSVCHPTELGCFSPDGNLITMGCYNKHEFTCFPGGNLCRRPLLACFDIENPLYGAKCEDIDKYASNIARSNNFIGSPTNYCDIRAKEIFE